MDNKIEIFKKNRNKSYTCCFFASFEKIDNPEIKDVLKIEIEKTIKEGYTHFLISVVRELDIVTCEILSKLKQKYKNIFIDVVIPSKAYLEIEGAEEIVQASDKTSVVDEKIFDMRKKERNFLYILKSNSKKIIIVSYIQDFGIDIHCIFNKNF